MKHSTKDKLSLQTNEQVSRLQNNLKKKKDKLTVIATPEKFKNK